MLYHNKSYGPHSGKGREADLLPLAFDCAAMITKLSKSLEYRAAGRYEKAKSRLDLVEGEIEKWLEKVEKEEVSQVDKTKLVSSLRGARQALDIEDLRE